MFIFAYNFKTKNNETIYPVHKTTKRGCIRIDVNVNDYCINFNFSVHMKTWKITYRFKDKFSWKTGYRIMQANSKEDAIRKMDLWLPLIKKVELI